MAQEYTCIMSGIDFTFKSGRKRIFPLDIFIEFFEKVCLQLIQLFSFWYVFTQIKSDFHQNFTDASYSITSIKEA